jgi:tRNA A37 methylthiotransferase MiaB
MAPRSLPHIHLAQSGDDGVLRRMGRRDLTADYAAIVGRIRAALPGVAVHADAIVGFPTEDDAAWDRSIAFIRSLDLAGLHVFRYSPRPGTAATRMTGHVDEPTKKRRSAELLALAANARACWAAAHVGREAQVLFETRRADGRWIGHAADHASSPRRRSSASPVRRPGERHRRRRRRAVDPERATASSADPRPVPSAAAHGPAAHAS